MSDKSKILIQIDHDTQASTFDSVVAMDSGVDHLLVRAGVTEADVEGLVHGAIFTRSGDDLKRTALFFGGNNVKETEALVAKAKASFFGPMQVSLMSDPNGANTTAAAAVLSAMKHIEFAGKEITVLAGTGPVGSRIAQLIAGPATVGTPATVNVCSRRLSKAQEVCDQIRASAVDANLIPIETSSPELLAKSVCNAHAVFAAGAAGVELLGDGWQKATKLQVAIDVNAVPPAGIKGIGVTDCAKKQGDITCYGAIGVGALKMKIHKRCIQMLFESNQQTLEVEEIFAIGREFQ
jgi:hypothetical protein